MISYISLLIGVVSAIIGAFLNPYKEDAEGNRTYSKWSFLFILIPLASFCVAAIGLYNSQTEAKKLKDRIEASIDRVDAFEIQITYKFPILDAGFSPEILSMMKGVLGIYAVITENQDGSLRYGIAKNMYRGNNTDSEDKLLKSIDKHIQQIRDFSPPVLFARRKDNSNKNLKELISRALGFGFVNIRYDKNKIPSDVARYVLHNPRLTAAFPPQHIANSTEY